MTMVAVCLVMFVSAALTAPTVGMLRRYALTREVLDIPTPAVISVEGAVARLRRASLSASLASRSAEVTVVPGPFGRLPESEVHPYRPRPRRLRAPEGDALARVYDLLKVGGSEGNTETLVLEPGDAAAKVVEQLREWGYLVDSEIPTP